MEDSETLLGPPAERLESGYQLFSAVYFGRGVSSQPKKGVRKVAPSWGTIPIPTKIGSKMGGEFTYQAGSNGNYH